jgi:serine/threonine protein phosphatase PrpC
VVRAPSDDLAAGTSELVALATRSGGRDNVTVILARVLAGSRVTRNPYPGHG